MNSAIKNHPIHPKYRPDIDGLRAIAVLAVVGFHAFPGFFKGGFIGVDVFFVISGYLIASILLEGFKSGGFSFRGFYSRRINRIFPALILVLMASCMFGWFALMPDEYSQLGKYTAAGAFFVSNLTLLGDAGYFDNAADTKPLLHLWSLGIEEQFYIIWPVALWLSWRRKISLFGITLIFFLISLLLNLRNINHDAVATFYSPQTRFWELLAGSLLAFAVFDFRESSCLHVKIYKWLHGCMWCRNASYLNSLTRNAMAFAGILLLVCGLWSIDKSYNFPGKWACIPVLATILIIGAGTDAWINKYILSKKIMVWFGLISFPLYLWHWPLLSFARIVEGQTPNRLIRVAAVLLAVFLAWITYRYIEKPFRSSVNKLKILVLSALMFLVGMFGLMTLSSKGFISRAIIIEYQNQMSQFEGPLWKYTTNQECLKEYDFPGNNKLAWWFCVKSSPLPPTVIIVGNSYANHLYPGLIGNPEFINQTFLHMGTCKFGGGIYEDPTHPCYGDRQKTQNDFIKGVIRSQPSLKIAIVSGLDDVPDKQQEKKILYELQWLISQNLHVVVVLPHLRIKTDPKICISRPFKTLSATCSFKYEEITKLRAGYQPLVDSIHALSPKIAIYDPNDMFCESTGCSYLKNDIPLFRDDGHFSRYGSEIFSQNFTSWSRANFNYIFDKPMQN